jgi:hypothetical protein
MKICKLNEGGINNTKIFFHQFELLDFEDREKIWMCIAIGFRQQKHYATKPLFYC